MICVFTLLISIVISLPSIIAEGIFGNSAEDLRKVEMYQNSIIKLDELNKEWIEEEKEKNSDCDEIEVSYEYSLTWYELIALDTVRYQQDFSKVNDRDILELGLSYMDRRVDRVTVNTGESSILVAKIKLRTKTREEVLKELGIKDEEDIMLIDNIYLTLLDMNLEGELQEYDEDINFADLQEYGEGSANLPYFNQTDSRWGNKSYGSSTIASGGCGTTALSMVVSGMTNTRIEPDAMANWSVRNGHRAEGAGSYWSLMTEGGRHFGLNVEAVSRKNPGKIKKALSEGKPVIVSMGKGHFTNGGHFIVLRGITSSGKILVHDPSSVKRSNMEWDLSLIMKESSKNGGASGSPFWIFSN